jgi:hypothetical protein
MSPQLVATRDPVPRGYQLRERSNPLGVSVAMQKWPNCVRTGTQAMLALPDSVWRQLIERLAFSNEHATVFTATSESTLHRALPSALVTVLLDRPTVVLPDRPRPQRSW